MQGPEGHPGSAGYLPIGRGLPSASRSSDLPASSWLSQHCPEQERAANGKPVTVFEGLYFFLLAICAYDTCINHMPDFIIHPETMYRSTVSEFGPDYCKQQGSTFTPYITAICGRCGCGCSFLLTATNESVHVQASQLCTPTPGM